MKAKLQAILDSDYTFVVLVLSIPAISIIRAIVTSI